MKADLPENEAARLEALSRYDILDTVAEQSYDDITYLAAHILRSPIAVISLVDKDRQWFKSKVGLSVSETPRDLAFCAHAILRPAQPMVVNDATRDARFATNPLVTSDPQIRFYLGVPLVTPEHLALGTLCVIDRVPRQPTSEEMKALSALSRQVVVQLELRRVASELQQTATEREEYLSKLERTQLQLQTLSAQLREDSLTDSLTGLKNRAAFQQRLEEEVYRSKRYSAPLSLLLIDVDHFKQYNDTYGHAAGDRALEMVAHALQLVRPTDLIARYGGEEFAAILPVTSGEMAFVMAERLRKSVASITAAERPITVSIGVSTFLPGGTEQSLFEAADQALYAAKREGRNKVKLASPETEPQPGPPR